MALRRPWMPSSSARTRRPLSEAMKFTVLMRASLSTASRKCFRNREPLAPVVATVRFWGAWLGKEAPGYDRSCDLRTFEHREASEGKSRRGRDCLRDRVEGPAQLGQRRR